MREDGVNRIQAKIEKKILDKNNVNDVFVRLDNARDIRRSQVNKIVLALESGGHYEVPLMTHKKGEKHRLLDGNHRHEAIIKYLERHPKRKVETEIKYYIGLTEEEERKMYTKWNSAVRPTVNDFIKQYWDKIPITNIMKKSFCWNVSHCWSTSTIEFKALVGAYLTKEDVDFRGGVTGTPQEFVDLSKTLGHKDVNVMDSFLKDYISIFGNPDKKNIHYKHNIFNAMFRIWLDNLGRISYSNMNKAFRRVRMCPTVVSYTQGGGSRDACIQCRIDLLRVMNVGRKSNLFI